MQGDRCRCLDDHCFYCNRAVGSDVCRTCRDGRFLLGGACFESCPSDMTSSGISQFRRRCLAPFTCENGRVVGRDNIGYGCKCAADDNTPAACRNCEFRANEFGAHCTRCNSGKFLHNNRCVDSCAGTGLIEYNPGSHGRECRAPFTSVYHTCTFGVDEGGLPCRCPRLQTGSYCAICEWMATPSAARDWGVLDPAGWAVTCTRCTDFFFLRRWQEFGWCSPACLADQGETPFGSEADGRECRVGV